MTEELRWAPPPSELVWRPITDGLAGILADALTGHWENWEPGAAKQMGGFWANWLGGVRAATPNKRVRAEVDTLLGAIKRYGTIQIERTPGC